MSAFKYVFIGILFSLLISCQTNYSKLRQIEHLLHTDVHEKEQLNDLALADSLLATYVYMDSLLALFTFHLEAEKRPSKQEQFASILAESSDYLSRLEAYQTDPSLYNLGGKIKVILADNKKKWPAKAQDIQDVLTLAPHFYQQAKLKLQKPQVDQLKLSIRKQVAGIRLMEDELQDSIKSYNSESTTLTRWEQDIDQARLALKDYIAWCNSQYLEAVADE